MASRSGFSSICPLSLLCNKTFFLTLKAARKGGFLFLMQLLIGNIMDILKDKIQAMASGLFQQMITVRRHLHTYPELSTFEFETAKYLDSLLNEFGIPHETGIAGTGIIGFINGGKGRGKTIALRADMDALPVTEKNDVPYKSKNEGVMHACGHDVHISCLLGAAKILNDLKDHFKGQVMLIFQPSEEKYPGGAKSRDISENQAGCDLRATCISGTGNR